MAFLGTPLTEAGNATFLTNGHNIDELSLEHSFLSPKKRDHVLVNELRKKRGKALRAPAIPTTVSTQPALPAKWRSGEFTPLLKSTSKRQPFVGRSDSSGAKLMARPKATAVKCKSFTAPKPESSCLYESESDQSKSLRDAALPLGAPLGSSVASTPLAVPHARKSDGSHDNPPNQMSLREQEMVRSRILAPRRMFPN